jgi:predicted PurR-regulated permease PerM
MSTPKAQSNFLLLLIALAGLVVFFIFKPFVSALVVGGTLAVVFHPLYRGLRKGIRPDGLAAGVTMVIAIVLIVIPLFFIGKEVVSESSTLYREVTQNGAIAKIARQTEGWLKTQGIDVSLEASRVDIRKYSTAILDKFATQLSSFFSSAAQLIIRIVLAGMAMYYFLKEGDKFKQTLMAISPLDDSEDQKLFDRVGSAINAVIRGALVIGIIQGTLTGIGFALFGLPHPVLWGSLAVIAALVPGIGTSLVIIPGAIYLWMTEGIILALGLFAWGVIAVGLIDNFLGPRLMRRGAKVHQFLVLLSVLGGITVFGPVGLIIGPVLASFLFALLDTYPKVAFKQE